MSWHSLVLRRNIVGRKLTHQGGFGLVELMVSISVMIVVASVILAQQGSFNGAVLLRSQAYEIALALREIQLGAVSASGDVGTFRATYGMYFNTTDDVHNGYYQIFHDGDGDGFYDVGEEIGQRETLDSRFKVNTLDAVGDVISGTELSVVFERPNFDARFFDASGSELSSASSIEINISRRETDGTTCGSQFRTIEVTRTGQIAVNDCP